MPKEVRPSPERTQTPRSAIHDALLGRALSIHEISVRASISEKDVAHHLEHIERSLAAKSERLVKKPAECLSCGFVFHGRTRHASPGKCPKCASEHIGSPTFRIETR